MKKIWSFVVFGCEAKNILVNEIESKLFNAVQNLFVKDDDVYISITKKDLSSKINFKLYISNFLSSDKLVIGEYKTCNFYAANRKPLASVIQKIILKKVEENVKS